MATKMPPSEVTVPEGANAPANDGTPIDESSSNNSIKKDQKNRRGLPLPDPIPETPVKCYPAPNKDELQKKVDEEDAKLQECFNRLTLAKSLYDQRLKIRDDSKPAFDAAKKEIVAINDECRQLFNERKTLSARLKELKDADIAARSSTGAGPVEMSGAGRDGNEALKNVRSMEDLEARIDEMKYHLETQSVSIAEEKRIVAQISFLVNKGRDFIREREASVKNEHAAKEARVTTRRELEEARNALDKRIDEAKAKLEVQKKIADGIRAKQDEEVTKLRESTPEVDRDEERNKITEIKGKIRKLRDDYQSELDRWYLNERIHLEQQKIAKRKKHEAIQAEREARRKAWEAEQAQYPEPHPYQAEKDMCAGLTVYLQTLLGEPVEKPAINLRSSDKSSPSLKSGDTTRVIQAEGQAIGKSVANEDMFGDLAFSDFVKKSNSKTKGKKGRRISTGLNGDNASSESISLKPHSIDYLTAFSRLDIKPPNKMSEVRPALEAVKAKEAFYDTAPAPEAISHSTNSKNQDEMTDSQTQSSRSMVGTNRDISSNSHADETAFPGLQSLESSNARSRTRDSSLPSFSAVASGSAAPRVQPYFPSPPPSGVIDRDDGEIGNVVGNDIEGVGNEVVADIAMVDASISEN